MSYLKFEKSQLTNLEFALRREFIRTNRSGAYGSTTIINCNTRKYHGLLVCPVDAFNNERFVLLSMLDASVVFNGYEFNLGIRKYSGGYFEPKGHKYIDELTTDTLPKLLYNVGGVKIIVEQVLDDEDFRVLSKYTIIESPKTLTLRLKPFLAFRNIHKLSKANLDANVRPEIIENGIRIRMYDGFPYLYMQVNKKPDFVHMPDWYYNVEYPMEQERGYEYQEDLFTPGFFEIPLKKGESVVFSAGTEELPVSKIRRRFTLIETNRIPRYNFENCLYNAAQQFIEKRKKSTYVISGYHWYDARTRDAFIAAPGLTLASNNPQTLINILDTAQNKLSNGVFPPLLNKKVENYCPSADTPLWFIYAIQQLQDWVSPQFIANKYWSAIKSIIASYYNGMDCGIKMSNHCLIYIAEENYPQTWMDAVVKNKPVTPRRGFAVEVNALWYNALMFSLEIAKVAKDTEFLQTYSHIPAVTKDSFIQKFWLPEGYLADFCTTHQPDKSIRPNQIIAAALPYSMLSETQKMDVIQTIKHKLLTPKGLRTLEPADERYCPYFIGSPDEREKALHQGTVHPWLLEFYAKALVSVYQKDALPELNKLFFGFENDMLTAGIGTINEVYDGDPPHEPRGAISQAWSVAAVLQIKMLMDNLVANQL